MPTVPFRCAINHEPRPATTTRELAPHLPSVPVCDECAAEIDLARMAEPVVIIAEIRLELRISSADPDTVDEMLTKAIEEGRLPELLCTIARPGGESQMSATLETVRYAEPVDAVIDTA